MCRFHDATRQAVIARGFAARPRDAALMLVTHHANRGVRRDRSVEVR